MDAFSKLSRFLSDLDMYDTSYTLSHNRENAIMVVIVLPMERWEVQFFSNETVEVERFQSLGFSDEEDFEALFNTHLFVR